MHNSIIFSNTRGKLSDVGSDIAVKADGRLTLSYCRLTEEEGSTGRPTVRTVTEASEGLITYDHVTFGDPGFMTSVEDYEKLLKYNGNYTYFDYTAAGIRDTTLLDVHLCSPAGMRLNDGTWTTDEIRLSDAIDKGDPLSPCENEPAPNGEQANLGGYGNTKDASCCAKAQPEIGEVAVSFPNGFARPLVTVTMGGNGTYFADVTISIGTGDVAYKGYDSEVSYSGVLNGTVLTVFARRCVAPGETFSWKVAVSAEGADDRQLTGTETVPSGLTVPDYDGKGGDPEKVVHVWPEVVSGNRDGYSWWDGCATAADALACLTAERNEIWIHGGTNDNLAALFTGWNKSFPVVIRGGFSGLENTPEDRAPGARTVLDGTNTVGTVLSVGNAQPLTFDGFDFVNGKSRGFYKSGDGAITLLNCGFRNNGATVTATSGRGAYLTCSTAAAATAVISNCVFEGNVQNEGGGNTAGSGLGLYVEKLASLTMDDTLFVTNGAAPTAGTSSSSVGRDGFYGSALYSSGVPVTARNCQFRGNRATLRNSNDNGGCVRLEGACGGSVFDHCLFVGNYENTGWNVTGYAASTCAGTFVINLANAGDTVTVRNSTIAYNLSGASTSAAGLSVAKGTLDLVDSIVFGNRNVSFATVGSDLALTTANGFANVSYTLFTSNDLAWVSGGATSLVKGDGVKYGDPLFVTEYTNAMAKVASFSYDAMRYDAAKLDEVVGFDAHLRSKAGYRTNDGTLVTGGTETSPAIDVGNPAAAYANEPSPNGECVNLGFYGNTANASYSVIGQPKIESVEADCVGDFTQPRVTVTLGAASADVDYKATVEVVISTNGAEVARTTESGLANGAVFVFAPVAYLAEGSTFDVSVTVTATGAQQRHETKTDVSVTGKYPEWIGHGGGAGVIHVWTGAPGDCSGSDWHNACHTWNEAVEAYGKTPGVREIWFIDVAKGLAAALTLTTTGDLALRGGFTNTNDAASERVPGAQSVLDGYKLNDFLKVTNGSGTKLTVERLVFCNSSSQGFVKKGAGDADFIDCDFLNNYKDRDDNVTGRGLHVTGTASETLVALRNCAFEGNGMFAGGAYLLGYGAGAYFKDCKRVTIDDCLFRTNGVSLVSTGPNFGGDVSLGTAIYATGAPLTVRNTKFISNHGVCRNNGYSNGGAVHLAGNCNGSAFTNCLFVGNSNRHGWFDAANGLHGGAIVVAMSDAAYTAEFVNCTVAYNLADGKTSPGGLNVYTGTVNAKNSIFFGNVAGGYTQDTGYDVDVKTGAFNADHCLFTGLDALYLTAQADGVTNLTNCLVGDPLFVTPFTNVTAKITNYGKANDHWYFAANGWDKPALGEATRAFLTTLNVHLRGGTGYTDETTGEKVTAYRRKGSSPAIDAGDPASDCSNEASPNGNRVNLGFYGNTPWATMSKNGLLIFVK